MSGAQIAGLLADPEESTAPRIWIRADLKNSGSGFEVGFGQIYETRPGSKSRSTHDFIHTLHLLVTELQHFI